MRKTEGATKAHGDYGYCKHLRKEGKRLAHKAERKEVKRSMVAEWCRDRDCTLNGKPAVIKGWSNDFATIAAVDGSQSFEWSWESVDRVMRAGGNFLAK